MPYCAILACWQHTAPKIGLCEMHANPGLRKAFSPSKTEEKWWEKETTEPFDAPTAASSTYTKLISPEEMGPAVHPGPLGGLLPGLAPIKVSRDPSIRNTGRFETISEDALLAKSPDTGYDFLNDDPDILFRREGKDPRKKKKKERGVPKTPDVTPRASLAATPRTPLGSIPSVPPEFLVDAHWVDDPDALTRKKTGNESDSTPEDSQFSSPVGSYSFATPSFAEQDNFLGDD